MQFVQLNLNPRGRRAADCVIRAIMRATGKPWNVVFLELGAISLKECAMPNEKRVYEQYLNQLGFSKRPMPRFPDRTRYTVAEFAQANPKGVFVISVAKHLTCIVDAVLYDTWNCSYKSVGNFYSK